MPHARVLFPLVLTIFMAPTAGFPAGHRDAPLTALDPKADITDVFAFRSYDGGSTPRVTFIMCVDPLAEPANGPHWWPFDPDVLYEIRIDNNNDAVKDVVFQFRFKTEQRLPKLSQAYAGAGAGLKAPANSPPPVAPNTVIVPAQVTSFNSPGFGQRQSYTVMMQKNGATTPITGSGTFYAVPANVGPRTMNYAGLYNAGTYNTSASGVRVFAGTVDDPFWMDLGGFYDTLNMRSAIAPGILSPAQDAANQNFTSDTFAGYAVNAIAIEVPVSLITRTGNVEPANSTAATIGFWGSTLRPRQTIRQAPQPPVSSGAWNHVQRMANPFINDWIIPNLSKDKFSMEIPKNDGQFAAAFRDPMLARIWNAATAGAITIPTPPRNDLLPLFNYLPPIAATGTPAGPLADLLRLNTGVPPTPPINTSRLGLLGGDPAGYPNGRRLIDDVTDVMLRLTVGVLNPSFNKVPNNRLGDGVNVNDAPYRTTFPYLADAPSGRDRRHIDPGEPGCTAGAGAACPQ